MLYTCWRYLGEDPVVRYRALDRRLAEKPPEYPWPSRVEAFRVACAVHAGQRERDLLSALQALGGGEG